jgi:prophage DNA circulation protein
MIATARKDSIAMARKTSLAALVALGALVSACSPTLQHADALPNRSLDSVNQPVVQRTDYVIDLTTEGDGLSAAERSRLDAWFASLGLGYGDRLWVDEAYGPSPARSDVARVAAEYGLLLSEGAPVTAGDVARHRQPKHGERAGLPQLGRPRRAERDLPQLRLRGQFEPRRHGRRSVRPGARPGWQRHR